MRCLIRLMAAVCGVLVCLHAATAQVEKRVALVIGNAAYRAVAELPNPKKDARDIATALRAAAFAEVVEHYDLDVREMRRALAQFEDKATGADWAVVYYAGHGIEVDGRNYLVPIDAELKRVTDVEDETLALERVLARVAAAGKLQLVILDACRDNPFKRRMAQAGGGRRAIGERGLARIEPTQPNVIVAYAARDGEAALDGKPGDNSPYARALLKYLSEPGLELGNLFRKVRDDVLAETGGKQRPFEYGSLTGQLLFFKRGVATETKPLVLPPPPSAAAMEWVLVDKTSIAELETFARRHPTSPEAEYARARLQELRKVALAVPPAPTAKPPLPKPVQQKKYDDGASDSEIRIGNTNPYSGPASAYGTIGKTIGAYFRMINDTGGINGRKITFVSYDDGYSPPKALEMARRLVEEDKVLFIFQTLGTPNNLVISSYLNGRQVPQLFVASGASKFGDAKGRPWTMGFQIDYGTEASLYARHILATVKDPKIAVLMQNDDYGRDYFDGFRRGLGNGAGRIVKVATYEVADPTVRSQIADLREAGANVLFNISTPKFAALAIRTMGELGWRPVHYLNSVSASVATVMKPAGLENAQGIITAVYLKDPADPQYARDRDFLEWRAFMQKYYPTGSLTDGLNAYAYSVANLMAIVLRQAGDDLTRANIMKQAANLTNIQLPMVIDGITVNTSSADYYPIQSARLSRLRGEIWEVFGGAMSAEFGR